MVYISFITPSQDFPWSNLDTTPSKPRGHIFANDKHTFSGEGFFWSKLPATTRIILLAPCPPHFGALRIRLPWTPLSPPRMPPGLPLGLPCAGHLPKLASEQLTGLHAPPSACPHSLNIVTLLKKQTEVFFAQPLSHTCTFTCLVKCLGLHRASNYSFLQS